MSVQARPAYLRAATVHVSWGDAERNLQELIFAAVRETLDASGLAFAEVDSVVLSAHDLVDGRSLSSMVSSPAAGAYLRDEVRLGDDGAAAVALATARVAAGLSRNCIVAGWGRASEGMPERISSALFDPFFTRPLGLTELAVSALRASGALRRFPAYRDGRAAVAARRRRDAAQGARSAPQRAPSPPRCHPLLDAEVPRWSDVVSATVVTSEPTDLRVAGVGQSSEPYWLGDRDLLTLSALAQASARALAAAGRSADELSVLELDGLTLFDEALAAEAVGAAPRGAGMTSLLADPRINAAGGYATGYCAPAMGLVRLADAAAALRARRVQTGGALAGLATGSSTVAAQTQSAIVLETC